MTNRDKFALAALPALLAGALDVGRKSGFTVEDWREGVAREEYVIADAMLAEGRGGLFAVPDKIYPGGWIPSQGVAPELPDGTLVEVSIVGRGRAVGGVSEFKWPFGGKYYISSYRAVPRERSARLPGPLAWDHAPDWASVLVVSSSGVPAWAEAFISGARAQWVSACPSDPEWVLTVGKDAAWTIHAIREAAE